MRGKKIQVREWVDYKGLSGKGKSDLEMTEKESEKVTEGPR